MVILHFKELGDTESVATNAVWVLIWLGIDNECSLRLFIAASNFKALEQLLMEILHLKDLGI